MALGPGKYDDATYVRERHGAVGVILLVWGGERGEGFEVQAANADPAAAAEFMARVPEFLEEIAATIRKDMAGDIRRAFRVRGTLQ
jgi:hypothetical protein